MIRAGVLIGLVLLLAGATLGFISPLAVPCVALLGGAVAGYLGARFERAVTARQAGRAGAWAGGLAGVGAWLGHTVGAVLTAAGEGPLAAGRLLARFGVSVDISSPWAYYTAASGLGCCLGLFELALMVGVGLLAGWVWFQRSGPGQPPVAG